MATSTYTEDEFKKVLKTLFAEKKRVKELEKQLEEKGLQKKFQAKLSDIHKLSLSEEYAKLKSAFQEREQESEHLKSQLDKVRPALKKLIMDLKSARAEVEILKAQRESDDTGDLAVSLKEALQKIEALEKEKSLLEVERSQLSKEESDDVQRHMLYLQEELEEVRKKNSALQEGQHTFDQKIESLTKALEEAKNELAHTQASEHKEIHRFEAERGRLVERLADALSQVQRQTEMINDLREELNTCQQQEKQAAQELLHLKSELAKTSFESAQINRIAEYQTAAIRDEKEALQTRIVKLEEELARDREAFTLYMQASDEREEHYQKLQKELVETKEQLQKSDWVVLREELSQKEAAHEEVLEKSYVKMRELSERHAEMVHEQEVLYKKLDDYNKLLTKFEKEQASLQNALKNTKLQCEERDAEIRKAQQHLAKKVKETTILRDLADRQKIQVMELQSGVEKQKNEIERLQNSLNLQRLHEEKLQALSKERAQTAESLTKEWQEKYLALQQDWQEKKGQLIELHKMRKTYDQMASTFSSLKNILGNSLDPAPEEPDYIGN